MKNILILTQELYPAKIGGSAKVALQQAQIFANLKYKVTIVTASKNSQPNPHKNIEIVNYDSNIQSQSLADIFSGKKTIKQVISKINFDLVLIHHPYIGKAFLQLKSNIPHIYMFHASTALETKWQGLDIAYKNILLSNIINPFFILYTKKIENQLLFKAKQIWTFSNFSELLVKKHFPKVGSKIIRVPYIADLEKFIPAKDKSQIRNKFNIKQNDILAITVRRLVPRMGLEWLINSWTSIIKKYPHIKLIIIGSGYLRPQLESLIHERKLGDKILLVGKLPEKTLINYYQIADLFILPTLAYEGLGLATIEALACGLPAIGTNIGATPEILSKFDKNLLLQNLDSPALLNCIDYAMQNKKELPSKARQFCENTFDQTKIQIFAELLNKALKL
jgi:glycosyltransferase involved in cell wall biosynthesis